MAALKGFTERVMRVAGVETQVRRGGEGTPLIFLHGEFGLPGWLDACALLANSFDVIAPSLPGFGRSARPDWIMSVHDFAAWTTWFARDLGIEKPVPVVGCSLGGWIAAEIACLAPQFMSKLVLVGPMGVKPRRGEIFDYFLEGGMTGLRLAFHQPDASAEFRKYWGRELSPDETDAMEFHRETTCRVAWKPYMHSLTLPHLLEGVRTPTLIVQGKEDQITPLDCGEIYRGAIPDARLTTIADAGHSPEMERPEEFARVVGAFLKG
jgi:pimeloyl-ACP methyl ester carboxylesterase